MVRGGWFGGTPSSFNKRRSTFTTKHDNGDRKDGIELPDDTIRVQLAACDSANEPGAESEAKDALEPDNMEVAGLRAELKKRGESAQGLKKDLIKRLKACL